MESAQASPTVVQRVVERFVTAAEDTSAAGFIARLKSLLDLKDRQLIIKEKQSLGGYDWIYITLINLPHGVGSAGGGAEAENNRLSFWVRGFDKNDLEAPAPTGKVKAEQSVSALPDTYRLRAKTGTPAAIAKYLADHLNKVVKEVEPKFTHTKRAASDQFVKDDNLKPKKLSGRYVKDFRTKLPGAKITVVKSEATLPRGWDYGNYTVLEFELKDGPTLRGAFTLNVAEGKEVSGVAALDAGFGTHPVPRDTDPERVVKRLIDTVGDHLKDWNGPHGKKQADDMSNTSTERVLSRFEEGKPADPTENMSPEDAAEWKRQHEMNKDQFKSADTLAEQAVRSRFEEGKPADPTENMKPEDAAEWEKQRALNKDKFKAATGVQIPLYIRVALRSVTANQDKSAPEKVDDYFKQVKRDNPSYTDSQAWATAWSIYCKHVNPGADSCHQDDYLTKSAGDDGEEAVVDSNEDWQPEQKRGEWNILIYKYSASRWSYYRKNPLGGGSGSTAYSSARAAFGAAMYRVAWDSVKAKTPGQVWVVEYAWDPSMGEDGAYRVRRSYWSPIPNS